MRPASPRSIISLPAAGRRAHTHGLTVGETVLQTRLQFIYVIGSVRGDFARDLGHFFLLCRSKSISYGVNIRGAGEVPSLRLSKAREGVAKVFPPPFLEVRPVSLLEFMQLSCVVSNAIRSRLLNNFANIIGIALTLVGVGAYQHGLSALTDLGRSVSEPWRFLLRQPSFRLVRCGY